MPQSKLSRMNDINANRDVDLSFESPNNPQKGKSQNKRYASPISKEEFRDKWQR